MNNIPLWTEEDTRKWREWLDKVIVLTDAAQYCDAGNWYCHEGLGLIWIRLNDETGSVEFDIGICSDIETVTLQCESADKSKFWAQFHSADRYNALDDLPSAEWPLALQEAAERVLRRGIAETEQCGPGSYGC